MICKQECLQTINQGDAGGTTALATAAWKGHEAVVKLLLMIPPPHCVNASTVDVSGRTPLMGAACASPKVVELILLRRECMNTANHVDNTGRTALTYAVDAGNIELVKILFKKIDASLADCEGMTLLMRAVIDEDKKMVRLLLSEEDCLETVNRQDNRGRSALHYATASGDQMIVSILLSLNSNMTIVHTNAAAVDEQGLTPLMVAASRGDYNMVAQLLSRRECLDTLNRQDLEGYTALAHAVRGVSALRTPRQLGLEDPEACPQLVPGGGHYMVIQCLLSLEDINVHTRHIHVKYGEQLEVTPLFHGVLENTHSIVQLLLSHRDHDAWKNWSHGFSGGDNTNKFNYLWTNVYATVIAMGCKPTIAQLHEEFLAGLLSFLKGMPTTPPSFFTLALADVTALGSLRLVRIMLEPSSGNHPADGSRHLYDQNVGIHALVVAIGRGHVHLVREFLGIRELDTTVADNESGFTPLMKAVSEASRSARMHSQEILDILLARKDCRDSINVQTKMGTALLLAIGHRSITVVKKLLAVETMNVTIVDERGDTPLIAACHIKNLDIVQELLMHEECLQAIDVKDSSGNTALSIAKRKGYRGIVKALVHARARNTVDYELMVGQTFSVFMGKLLIPSVHVGGYRDRLKPVMVRGLTN